MGLNPKAVRSEIVEVLRLNCERLAGARKKRFAKADTHRKFLRELANDLRASDQLLEKYVEALTEEMLAPNKAGHLQPFWSVWRQALGPCSKRWIETNRVRLNLPAVAS